MKTLYSLKDAPRPKLFETLITISVRITKLILITRLYMVELKLWGKSSESLENELSNFT